MVIDTSALVAILQDEPERSAFNEAIEAAERRAMSAASFVEASMVIEARYGPDGVRDLDLFIAKAGIELDAVAAPFREEPGAVLQVRDTDLDAVRAVVDAEPSLASCVHRIGTVEPGDRVRFTASGRTLHEASRTGLHRIWSETSWRMRRLRDDPRCADEEYARIADVCQEYAGPDGGPVLRDPANPNVSEAGVAGVTTPDGRLTIMMPHPERIVRAVQHSWHPPDWDGYGPWLRLFANARRQAG